MAFTTMTDTIDTFCLEEGQRFEFFLNLGTLSTNGNDVFAIGLSTSENIYDSIVKDQKHGGRKGNDFHFHLYYRGVVKPGQTKFHIVYAAEAKRFQNPISNEWGFSWGYKLLPEHDNNIAVAKATPCCEINCVINNKDIEHLYF